MLHQMFYNGVNHERLVSPCAYTVVISSPPYPSLLCLASISLIVKRWWVQYSLLPWPDSLAIYLVAVMEGRGERVRLMKRNIIR